MCTSDSFRYHVRLVLHYQLLPGNTPNRESTLVIYSLSDPNLQSLSSRAMTDTANGNWAPDSNSPSITGVINPVGARHTLSDRSVIVNSNLPMISTRNT